MTLWLLLLDVSRPQQCKGVDVQNIPLPEGRQFTEGVTLTQQYFLFCEGNIIAVGC